MPCFGSKRVEIVPMDGDAPVGRLEPSAADSKTSKKSNARDGLHSAPTGQDVDPSGADRAGLHSAPVSKGRTASKKGGEATTRGEEPEVPLEQCLEVVLSDLSIVCTAIEKAVSQPEPAAVVEKRVRSASWGEATGKTPRESF